MLNHKLPSLSLVSITYLTFESSFVMFSWAKQIKNMLSEHCRVSDKKLQKIINFALKFRYKYTKTTYSIVGCFYRDTSPRDWYITTLVSNASVSGSAVQACSTKCCPCQYSFWSFSKKNMQKYDAGTKFSFLRNNSWYFNNLVVQLECRIPKQHLMKDTYVDRKTVFRWFFLFHKYAKTSFLNPLGVVKESIFVVSIE